MVLSLIQAEAGGFITSEELELRTINFSEGDNGVVITDNDLTDLSSLGAPSMRLTNNNDLLVFTSLLLINQDDGNGGKFGITVPLGDEFSLTSTEQGHISDRVAAYNATINSKVTSSGGKLALWDAHAFYEEFAAEGTTINPMQDQSQQLQQQPEWQQQVQQDLQLQKYCITGSSSSSNSEQLQDQE